MTFKMFIRLWRILDHKANFILEKSKFSFQFSLLGKKQGKHSARKPPKLIIVLVFVNVLRKFKACNAIFNRLVAKYSPCKDLE